MNKVDKLISECIDQLADDRVDSGVEALYELAGYWKSAGLPVQSWRDICGYIEQSAIKKSDENFVQMKIHNALVKIREQKHGKIVRLQ
jgi:hypothetical protein